MQIDTSTCCQVTAGEKVADIGMWVLIDSMLQQKGALLNDL